MRVASRRFRLSAAAASLAVAASMGAVSAQAATVVGRESTDAQAAGEPQPDAASASVAAVDAGQRVEDISARTETGQVFANPDGSFTAEEFADPVRTVDVTTGEWAAIDTDLVAVDGRLVPKNAIGGLQLSDGGETTFATMDPAGGDVQWKWPDPLPEPRIEGNIATYPNVVENGDLVVTALPAGFRHDIVLHEAPADPVDFIFPVITGGPKVTEQSSGTLSIGAAGDDVLTAPQPVMYDSSVDHLGDPVVLPVDTSLTPRDGGSTLTLSPAHEFLSDPETVYPVTVDPTWSAVPNADTYITTTNPTSNFADSPELRVGTPNAGTHKARGLVKFDLAAAPWMGAQVNGASLTLNNFASSTCNGGAVRVHRLIEPFNSTTATWENQPRVTGYRYTDSSIAKGATGCAAGDVTWDVTGMAQVWAERLDEPYGFRISGVDENNTNTWRRYRSTDAAESRPRLRVDYVFATTFPSLPTISGCTADGCEGEVVVTEVQTPVFSTSAQSLNGAAAVNYDWEVRAYGSQANLAVGTTTALSAAVTNWAPMTPLSDGRYYEVRVTARAGTVSRAATPWSTFATSFPVDEAELPETEETPEEDVDAEIEDSAVPGMSHLDGERRAGNLAWRADGGVGTFDLPVQLQPLSVAARAGDSIPFSGWAACPAKNTSERNKIVKKYKRATASVAGVPEMKGSHAYLNCGLIESPAYGFRHIRAKHADEFQGLADVIGRQWRDVAGYMVGWTLKDPARITHRAANGKRAARFCMIRKFTLVNERNEDTGVSTRVVVLMGKTARRIMTAFPTVDPQWCVNRLPATTILE